MLGRACSLLLTALYCPFGRGIRTDPGPAQPGKVWAALPLDCHRLGWGARLLKLLLSTCATGVSLQWSAPAGQNQNNFLRVLKNHLREIKMASLWMNSWNKYKMSTLAEIPKGKPGTSAESTLQNDCYKMAIWLWNRRILKHEFHVLEHHRSLQEPDVLWRFKNRTDWYPKKWT